MSQNHRPGPRQNVHRQRSPVTVPIVSARSRASQASAAVRKINQRFALNGSAVRKITPGQAAALQASGSRTY
jgi:hypothetical protein